MDALTGDLSSTGAQPVTRNALTSARQRASLQLSRFQTGDTQREGRAVHAVRLSDIREKAQPAVAICN